MADQEVKIRISTDPSSGIAGIDRFKASMSGMESSSAGLISKIKANWMGLSAAIYAVYTVSDKVWDMGKIGAAYSEQEGILNNLSRKYSTTATTMIESMARASQGLIAKADLMQIALGGIAKKMSPDQMIKLAGAANLLGDTVGKNATVALRELSEALESGRARTLKGYAGATIDLTGSFGTLEKKMTDVEKANAMYSLIMIHATRLQKEQTNAVDSAADKVERIEATYNNATRVIAIYAKTVVAGAYDAAVAMKNLLPTSEIIMARLKGLPPPGAGPKVYEVPPPAGQKPPDPLAEYNNQIAALKKILQARKDDDDAIKHFDRIQKDILASETKANQEYYESAISASDHWLKMQQLNGTNELNFAVDIINKKQQTLNRWYDNQAASINDHVQRESERQAKLSALDEEYGKKWNELANQREEKEKETYLFRLTSLNVLAAWDQDTLAKMTENMRNEYGKRRKISESTWDAMYEFERMTGQKMTEEQASNAELTLALYEETLVGGWKKGMLEISDEYRNVGAQMTDISKRAFGNMTDSLTDFVKTGKLDFSRMVDSFISDLIRMQIQASITGPLSKAMGGGDFFSSLLGAFSGGAGDAALGSGQMGGVIFSRRGNVFSSGDLIPFARGGVVTRPHVFPFAKGTGIMGEAGPEAIMPLARLPGGDLGVKTGGNNKSEATTVNNNFFIQAVDAKSFEEICRRNPGAIVGPVTQSLQDNRTRSQWKGLLNK